MKAVLSFLWRMIGYFIVAIVTAVMVILVARFLSVPLAPASSYDVLVAQQQSANADPLAVMEAISAHAIESSARSLQVVQWTVGAFVVSLLGIAVATTNAFTRDMKEATTSLNGLSKQYEDLKKELDTTRQEYASITGKYQELQLDFLSMELQTMRMDVAVEAYQDGRITRRQYNEIQAWHAWQKWKFGRDATGYEELMEYKKALDGLPMPIVRSAIAELSELQSKLKKPGRGTPADADARTRLKKLLNI